MHTESVQTSGCNQGQRNHRDLRQRETSFHSLKYCCYSWVVTICLVLAFVALDRAAGYGQTSASDFTVVVLPDPQNAIQFFPQVFNSQMQ